MSRRGVVVELEDAPSVAGDPDDPEGQALADAREVEDLAVGGEEKGLALTVKLEDKPGALATVASAIAKAGGNILNLVPLRDPRNESGEVYIKELGADPELLAKLIEEEAAADLIEIGPARHYEPKLYGKQK